MKQDLPSFVIVPYDRMEELMLKVDKLTAAVLKSEQSDKGPLGDRIPENEAKELLNKGSTWFWNKRKSGELNGRKFGNKWYYSRSEIQNLIENGKQK